MKLEMAREIERSKGGRKKGRRGVEGVSIDN
jgi:hypothetical protein